MRRRNITLRNECPARAHVWGKQAERSEAVGGITHDASGNVAARYGGEVPGEIQTFTYTPFDLPATISSGYDNPRVTSFEYTADEERVVRGDPDRTHHYVAGNIYERVLSPTGETQEEHFRISAGGSVVAEIIRTPGGEQTLYFHPDALGTPETISDAAGATFHQKFTPFGTRSDSAASAPTRIGFTGQKQDDDLALIDMGGRVYDPIAGRFTTADPMMQAPYWSDGQNPYAYVFGDPINNTDPSGYLTTGTVGGDVATGAVVGTAWGGVGYGILSELGVSFSFSFTGSLTAGAGAAPAGAVGAAGVGAAGMGLGPAMTLLANPFGGSSSGRYPVASPSGSPSSSAMKPNGTHAVGQARATQPLEYHSPERFSGPDARIACYPACAPDPNSAFPDTPAGRETARRYFKAYLIVGGVVQAAGGIARMALERLAFTAVERAVIHEVRAIPLGALRAAYAAGGAELNIAGRTILVDPGVPASGMTLFGENGFVLGREAFKSTAELTKTLLHETYRLATSQSTAGVSGAMATSETNAAWAFAERAFGAFF